MNNDLFLTINKPAETNYKIGDGFRPNSDFESINTFQSLNLKLTDRSKLTSEITYLEYLAHQAGGLSDRMFEIDPYQSNRERNWFQVKWLLYNLKYLYEISPDSIFLSILSAPKSS